MTSPTHPAAAPPSGAERVSQIHPRNDTRPLPDAGRPHGNRAQAPGRERLAAWIFGLGLALVALALPQERLIGEAFAGGFEQSPFWAIWHRAGLGIGRVAGIQGEQARFGLAALAYGTCLPVALGFARRLGIPFGAALVASITALLSPTAWIAGTTPGMTSISLLLLLLLARTLWSHHPQRPRTSLTLWAVLVGTQTSNLALWPAIAWALLAHQSDPVARRRTGWSLAIAGVGVTALALTVLHADWDPVPLPATLELGATRWSLDPRTATRVLAILPGLGVAFAGLVALWLRGRQRTGPSAFPGLLPWCLGPAAFLACNSILTWDASCHWLVPVAWIGLCLAVRPRDSRCVSTQGAFALPLQILLLFGVQSYITGTDPLADWRERARICLAANDTLITGDVPHAYLAAHRFGLRSVFLCAADPDAPSTEFVDGIYADPGGLTNLRIKTQPVDAWAGEGVEAHGFGFRPVLDRPFPGPSKEISEALERELRARVGYLPFDAD